MTELNKKDITTKIENTVLEAKENGILANKVRETLQSFGFDTDFTEKYSNLIKDEKLLIYKKDGNIYSRILNYEYSDPDEVLNLLKRSVQLNQYDEYVLKKSLNVYFKNLDNYILKLNDIERIFDSIPEVNKEYKFDVWEENRGMLYGTEEDTSIHMVDFNEEILEDNVVKIPNEEGLIISENFDKREKLVEKKKHYQHFLAGAFAGGLSRTITAPLERLKILYQVNYIGKGMKPPGIIQGLAEVYKKDGFKGLFRGNLINLMKCTPDTAIRLYMFEKVKYLLQGGQKQEKLQTSKLFIAGASAGVCANLTIFPMEVTKTRLSAAPSGTYHGIFDALSKIYKEGGPRIFYKGIDASICAAIPNSGLNLTFYELLKRLFSGSHSSDNSKHLSTPTLMFIGGLSAMFSSTILYPFQTVQSRIIMQGLNSSSDNFQITIKPRLNMIQIIQNTLSIEGYKGFFKGYRPGITKIVIGNALGFSLYENIKHIIS